MEVAQIEEKIRWYIENDLIYERSGKPLTSDEWLLEDILDSLNMLRLYFFLEAEFGLTVPDGDMVPDNFGTVRKIATYVWEKTR